MKQKLYYIFFLFLIPFQNIYGQETIFDEPSVVYKNTMYGNIILHNNGWGLGFSYARNLTVFKSRLFEVNVVGMKHPKERRSYNPYEETRSFIFGKSNSFLILRPLYGVRKIINDKIRKSGVQVGYSWSAGPAIGLLKPVYLEIAYPSSQTSEYLQVERYSPEDHPVESIYGRATWFKGINEMKLEPGITGKFAVFFEFSSKKDGLKGIEVGGTVDVFTKKVEIMANDLNRQIYYNLFLSFQFGKKYNTIE